jgi:hypothetical protein
MSHQPPPPRRKPGPGPAPGGNQAPPALISTLAAVAEIDLTAEATSAWL